LVDGAKAEDKGQKKLLKKQPLPIVSFEKPSALSLENLKEMKKHSKSVMPLKPKSPLDLDLVEGNKKRELKKLSTVGQLNPTTLNDSSSSDQSEDFEGGESDENPEILPTDRPFNASPKNNFRASVKSATSTRRSETLGSQSRLKSLYNTQKNFLKHDEVEVFQHSEAIRKNIFMRNLMKNIFKSAASQFMPKILTPKELAILYKRIVNKR